jgi:ankyrin repeat protein
MDIDVQFLYSQFINLNRDVQFIYVWLAAFFIFIVWQVSTNPISRISNAVSRGNINQVRKCLEKGADVDLQSSNGVTLLYLACDKNHIEIAKLLISYGANVNQGLKEEYGRNPLLVAAIGKHSELTKMLVANGAKIGLHLAALQGDIDTVKTFLEQETFPVNSIREGMTPLCLATIGGHLKIAQLLLDRGAILDFLHYQNTPLYQAAKFNHIELVDLLIDRGSDPNHARTLHTATCRNYQELVKQLIEKGVDVNYQDGGGTPLHAAAENGLIEIVELLIANGAQVSAKSKSDASTPLHHAAENGFIEIAEMLIANGAQMNTHGGFNSGTPLLYAAEKGHLLMVKLLIRSGANVNSASISLLPSTPLDHARSNGHTEVMQLLKSYGAIQYGFLD